MYTNMLTGSYHLDKRETKLISSALVKLPSSPPCLNTCLTVTWSWPPLWYRPSFCRSPSADFNKIKTWWMFQLVKTVNKCWKAVDPSVSYYVRYKLLDTKQIKKKIVLEIWYRQIKWKTGGCVDVMVWLYMPS